MLDKRSKIILDTLIKNNYTYPQADFVSIEETLIPLLPEPEKYNWRRDTVSTCVQYLENNGYVSGEPFFNGYYPVPNYRELHVTYKGWHYKNFKWLQLKYDLFKSVLIPVIVALITTAITTCVGYIWGHSVLKNNSPSFDPSITPSAAPTATNTTVSISG